jgi:putative tryptophan/tyrosine transport system substrate-binding protein
MDRRAFIAGTFALLAAPLGAKAQTAPNVARIGVLEVGSAADASARMESFRKGLRQFGRVEGQGLTIEWRFAEGQSAKLSRLAVELVELKPDILVTSHRAGMGALRSATTAIPIVVAGVDAGTTFFAPQNLARPVVGNVTGVISMASEGDAKRMDLLRETRPAVSRVAALRDLTDFPYREGRMSKSQSERWGFTFIAIVVGGPDDFKGAFAAIIPDRVGALSLPNTPMFYTHRRQLAELAVRHRLAWIAEEHEYAEAGCLMSFGANGNELVRQAATYVDKILKGAKPADLPIEQPTRFELVINLKTAKALKLTIPPSVLNRADQVIQ